MRLASAVAGMARVAGVARVAASLLCMSMTVHAADVPALIASARHGVETEDSRATGHLVRVDAGGNRISNTFAIKAHWFPGVLRVLLEIVPAQTPEKGTRPETRQETRVRILFEMRPNGQNTIRVFRPHESAPAALPFAEWSGGVSGSDFNYEDFLQAAYYWQNQAFLKSARVGAHDCDVLKSTPGASDRTHYVDVQTWFDHTTGYPLYVEKTLREASVVKEFTSFGLRQSDGVWAARQVEVKIHGRPGSTLLIFDRGSTRANLTLKDFSPEQISRSENRP